MSKAVMMAALVVMAQGGWVAQASAAAANAFDGVADTVDDLVNAVSEFGQRVGLTKDSVPFLGDSGPTVKERRNTTDRAAERLENYVNSHNTSWEYIQAANLTTYGPMEVTIRADGDVVRNYTAHFNTSSKSINISKGEMKNETLHWTVEYEDITTLRQAITDENVSTAENVRLLKIWDSIECSSDQDGLCKQAREDIVNAAYQFF